jgi:hypothetical protein
LLNLKIVLQMARALAGDRAPGHRTKSAGFVVMLLAAEQ